MKKTHLIALCAVCLLLGLWFVEVFPDPYHQNGYVNIYVWVYRELKELKEGEV